MIPVFGPPLRGDHAQWSAIQCCGITVNSVATTKNAVKSIAQLRAIVPSNARDQTKRDPSTPVRFAPGGNGGMVAAEEDLRDSPGDALVLWIGMEDRWACVVGILEGMTNSE